MWLSEKNNAGQTGRDVLKSEFSSYAGKLATLSGATMLVVGSAISALPGAAFTGVVAFEVTRITDRSLSIKESFENTNFKTVLPLGALGGALFFPFMLPVAVVGSARDKWKDGNAPK